MSKVIMSFELEKPKIRKLIAKPAKRHKDKSKYSRKSKYKSEENSDQTFSKHNLAKPCLKSGLFCI